MITVWVLLASTVAQAQSTSVQAVFERHDLIGTFAADCNSPPSNRNYYFVHRASDGFVQRDRMSGPSTRDWVVLIDQARELRPNEISVSGMRDGTRFDSVYRAEPGRMRVMESTVGGKKEIAGGRLVSGGEMPWYRKCGSAQQGQAPMPAAPAAMSQASSVQAIFEKHSLLGTFALDCGRPPGDGNPYFVNRALDDGNVQRDRMGSPTTRDWIVILEAAKQLRPNEIAVSGTFNGQQPAQGVYRAEPGRMRVLESTIAGKNVIVGGRFGGRETPWEQKCEAR
jgi:hypothetical protein